MSKYRVRTYPPEYQVECGEDLRVFRNREEAAEFFNAWKKELLAKTGPDDPDDVLYVTLTKVEYLGYVERVLEGEG